ncbi:MAG: glycosyltransferase [Armatimonadota bacterium]|nr:glycosyltransferase [Armatimonadota bacterium]
MKIGVFVDSYKPIVTGVVHSVDLLRSGLEALGHEVHIFAPAARGYRDVEDRVYRFPAINLSRRIPSPLALPVSPRVLALIPRLGLDVIHTQHPFPIGRLGVTLARRLGVPAVYTFHTQYEHYVHYVPLPRGFVRAAARWAVVGQAERCQLVICPAPSVRDLLLSYGIRRPIEILPNPIDLGRFAGADGGAARRRLGIASEERVLLYCGRLAREKNLAFMLQALADVLVRPPGARLLIVGHGTERAALARLAASLALGDRVVFAGEVAYADVAQYYAAADLFVMTSVTEVKPLAVLEAMASGLPVVAVAAHGLNDTVTHGADGLLTDHDPAAFADAVRRLLADDAGRRMMGRRARQTAEQYDVRTIARRLADLYAAARDLHRQGIGDGRRQGRSRAAPSEEVQ